MSTPGNREVAYRLFATEFDDAEFSYSESDEERAPNYVVTPSGARVNRLFAVGVLTEVAQAGESILRARVVDPTGAFVVYAGQYQPDAMAFLERAETPSFVAVTGKARTFQPDDADVVYTSVRPESISVVDAETRDRWTVTTAERTLDRLATMGAAVESGLAGDELREALREAGVDHSLAAGIAIARREYGTDAGYLDALQSTALDCLRLVAGETDTVGSLDVGPATSGSFTPVRTTDIALAGATGGATTTGDPADATGTTDDGADASFEPVEEASTEESSVEEPSGAEPEGDDPVTEEPVVEGGTTDEPGRQADDGPTATGDGSAEAEEMDPEEFDLDDDTRQEVEEEFGVEFETAAEVDPAGEADLDTDEPSFESVPEEPAAEVDDGEPSSEPTEDPPAEASVSTSASETVPETAASEPTESAATEDTENAEPPAEAASEPAADVSIDDVLMDTMRDLDDGDGAPADALVSAVVDATGAEAAAVEDAIQDALMSGQCYEPDDGHYKPI